VQPEIENGRFPVKRTIGEKVVVEGDIFTDGHDTLAAQLLYRHEQEAHWHRALLRFSPNRSIQCAENPPKKYQDIYPFDFETASCYVELNPQRAPTHIFCIRRRVRSERDFDYDM
jgi:hypothetical protein